MSDLTSRRAAIKIGGGGALALLIGGTAGWLDRRDDTAATSGGRPTTPSSTSTTGPVVVPTIGEVDPGLVTLGRRVVDTQGWDDLRELLAAVPDPDGDPLAQAAAVVRDEFRAGVTVRVDGWVLARSEAQAAAAIALICDDAC